MSFLMRTIISFSCAFLLITILNFTIFKKKKCIYYLFGYIFLLYLMIALTQIVGFPSLHEWKRLLRLNQPIINPNINLYLFKDGIEISSILNIIFFIPLGFLLPTLWGKYHNLWKSISFGILFSLIIEFGQLFVKYRVTDIDDLVTNVIGTILGWILFQVLKKIFFKAKNNTLTFKLEPYVYIIIAITSAFLS